MCMFYACLDCLGFYEIDILEGLLIIIMKILI